ncbi:zinc-binding oxidoreductase ToxD [Elsinoe ampelina]|uniref:Zinc-binding oxidoreductase ToxD n=1 Tax=Elsinoe ampelina TaxID=302913 RepID=A0A6A6GRD5_9PEZI|nr:zinc-binding oxidoreductase ToxD [Elsinoe ampelina]
MSESKLPARMMAVKSVIGPKGNSLIRTREVPLPRLRKGYALVRVFAVALNPSDWQKAFFITTDGATLGTDFAGVLVQLSENDDRKLQPGDRVFGMTMNSNPLEHEDGCFGEYALVKQHLLARIPDTLSFTSGCTLGTAIVTAGLVLYRSLDLEMPKADSSLPLKDEYLLVNGGSTATGTIVIQLARLSGYRVISTNRPHNDELVLAAGAERTFDYRQEHCAVEILNFTRGTLTRAVDCISSSGSAAICSTAMGKAGGKVCFLLPMEKAKVPRNDVVIEVIYAYSAIDEPYEIGLQRELMQPLPEDVTLARQFLPLSESLLSDNKIKPHPIEKRSGGLGGIHRGLKDLQDGKISGRKLVYEV